MTLNEAMNQFAAEALAPFLIDDPLFPVTTSLLDVIDQSFLMNVSLHLTHLPAADFWTFRYYRLTHKTEQIEAFLSAHVNDVDALYLSVLAESRHPLPDA